MDEEATTADAAPAEEPPAEHDRPSAPLIRWTYSGEREDLHGEQVAAIGATVSDDIFGDGILRGDGLLISFGEEERTRTSGHVYYKEPPAEVLPAALPATLQL